MLAVNCLKFDRQILERRINPRKRKFQRPRDGFFLLLVLVVVAVATLAVYTFTETMIVMDDAAYLESSGIQSQMSVESSAAMLQVLLSSSREQQDSLGGLYQNPAIFAAQPIAPEGGAGGVEAFTILASGMDSSGRAAGVRYGLVDESTRLNVNTLAVLDANHTAILAGMLSVTQNTTDAEIENVAVSMLLALPGMTVDVAEAILDWIDIDDEPREFGAESETYATLPQPYQPANGPITSVDELLLVRGVTPTLMYGADANRNGVLDASEQQRFAATIDTPGVLGWASMLTSASVESNLSSSGVAKVDVNGDDLEAVYEQLGATVENQDFASFIVAYRVAGQAASTDEDVGEDAGLEGESDDTEDTQDASAETTSIQDWSVAAIDQVDLTGGGEPISQLLDLVDAEVTVTEDGNQVTYRSPFANDPVAAALYLPDLLDQLTASGTDPLPGRLNINACPAELLSGIPTLSIEQIDRILETRDPASQDPGRRHATWLWTEGIVDLAQMRQLMPILCGGGNIFRAQSVGYHTTGGAFSRWEIILDNTDPVPRIISRRNLSHLGRGFDLSVLGVSPLAN